MRLRRGAASFTTVDEAFALARRRLPATLYARTTAPGRTAAENHRVFDDVWFRPRAATVHEQRDLTTSVLGERIALPVLVGCPGAARIVHPDGDVGGTAAAGRAGTIKVLAMATGHPLEEAVAAATGPVWQQLYLSRGRAGAEELMERAARAGCRALVVTVDIPLTPVPVVPGVRVPGPELNRHNAFAYGAEAVRRPRWLAAFVRDAVADRGVSDVERLPVVPGASPARLRTGALENKLSATWDDFEWIRSIWRGPVVVKGVLSADDARRAVDVGASAVVVSNHGGTSLHVSSSLRVLPEVVAAVGDRCEVLFDGGIRSGADVAKAVALGARAVLIGRAYLMGLAVAGGPGVDRILDIVRRELDQTLGALGCRSIGELDASYVETPSHWPR